MELIIDNKCIDAPLSVILQKLKSEIGNGKLRDINIEDSDNIKCTCPKHKDGFESHPSCYVYARRDNVHVNFGQVHCFTCGYTASLPRFIEDCFNDHSENFGNEWLVERFGTPYKQNIDFLSDIEIDEHLKNNDILDESILRQYNYYHPYMWKRKLTKQVVDEFKVGFDPKTNMLSFPVWDERGNLKLITYRSVNTKKFYIDKSKNKPVYLLYDIIKRGITSVCITEAQIDALTAWTFGYPCIATMGSPSTKQINSINKSGIRHLILMFDNDAAGKRFSEKLKKNLRSDIFISEVNFPAGVKDINDLTKDQFEYMIKNLK